MKKFQTSLITLALLAAASASHADACDASAGNLVANCGFETGDFTSWTTTGNDVTAGTLGNLYGVEQGADPFDNISPNGGSNQAWFNDLVANSTTISQSLSTVATATYLISFYLAQDTAPNNDPNGEGLNQVVATFGGQSLTLKQVPVQGYTLESFTVKTSSWDTNLSISLGNGVGEFLLDDISVTNVPEPASWALVGIALVGVGGFSRKRKA